jgi:hypothetical protein
MSDDHRHLIFGTIPVKESKELSPKSGLEDNIKIRILGWMLPIS